MERAEQAGGEARGVVPEGGGGARRGDGGREGGDPAVRGDLNLFEFGFRREAGNSNIAVGSARRTRRKGRSRWRWARRAGTTLVTRREGFLFFSGLDVRALTASRWWEKARRPVSRVKRTRVDGFFAFGSSV